MLFETRVKEVILRTSDVSSFRFPRPAEFTYKPGQYLFVTIRSDDKELMHTFSLSSSPTEMGFIEFTKKFTDSEYSTKLKVMRPGDWAKIDAPHGSFTFMGEHEKIVMLAGGIGITPFRSICKYCTDMHLDTSIVMFYGCRSENDIAFKMELEDLQKQNQNLKVIIVLNDADSGWKGKVGFINSELVKKEVPDYKERVFFACGPPGMIVAMGKVVDELGLPKEQFKLESFTGHT
jgi:ferredoxin-NADP reductase